MSHNFIHDAAVSTLLGGKKDKKTYNLLCKFLSERSNQLIVLLSYRFTKASLKTFFEAKWCKKKMILHENVLEFRNEGTTC